jgi:1-acyl-sn-glycerol-3-phosphate acyltransferase
VHVRGLERLPKGTCILVSNHQSNFDPVVVFACVPKHIRFVAKAELFRIPFFGSWLKQLGNLRVERGGSDKDRKTLEDAVSAVREKVSVMFFPEGTRSADGELRKFKKGAAMLAIQAQVPLVPMALAGTREILPTGSPWIRGGRQAALIVGEPIPTAGMGEQDREALTQRSREAVAGLLEQAQRWLKEQER